jgi:hypothetical protein
MKWLILFAAFIAFMLTGCEDRYRYACQNPDNFALTECQKPRCLFTQTCPEYLVAPVLEKKIEPPAPQASSDR